VAELYSSKKDPYSAEFKCNKFNEGNGTLYAKKIHMVISLFIYTQRHNLSHIQPLNH
jgi:hypothetical protein